MENLYFWTGVVVIWFFVLTGIISLLIQIGNKLGKKYKSIWIIVEYAYYRKKFKEWVKDQKRHPKTSSKNEDGWTFPPPDTD